jgi:adenosylcobinamide-GDP ribazoletransferase
MSVSQENETLASEHFAAWRQFFAAVQFLTRVPVPATWTTKGSLTAASLAYFPLVGTLVGAGTGVAIWLLSYWWSIGIAVLLAMTLEAIMTGALHEDALADCCDGFGGGWTRDEVLRIFGDSRVGAFGVLGLMLAVGLKAAALATMPAELIVPGVIASATLGRWSMAIAPGVLPPIAGRSSLSAMLDPAATRRATPVAALLVLPGLLPLAWFAPQQAVLAVIASMFVAYCFVIYVRRRIGGMTGDCLGCLCLLVQIVVLLVLAARWHV